MSATDLPQNAPAGTTPHKSEIYLSDYQVTPFTISHIDLKARLDSPKTQITARLYIKRQAQRVDDLWLDGGPYMTLTGLIIDGQSVPADQYEVQATGLLIKNVPDEFILEQRVDLLPDENTHLEGLYRSGGTFCTQCEAEGFRHIIYMIDRPDILATYRVRLEGREDSCPVLLSNGNPVGAGKLADGWHYSEWDDPFPKPCYLFALVAGSLTPVSDYFITSSGKKIELNVYVRAEDQSKCGHALESLKGAMRWDQENYNREYDLDVYNIVAVSDFNMGAMENKGLNIFNTKYVLATEQTATDTDYNNIAAIVAHEYFHNWTGNRITCRDWFQLSLKEGLTVYRDQEFSSDMLSASVKRLDDVRSLRFIQFAEDSSPLAHPVRPDRYIEINNFYTATVYNKGAEVIRMLATLIGKDAFHKGMDIYFDRFDGQAVTCEDFIQAMADASGRDLSHFFRWYQQSGTPRLTVKRNTLPDGQLELSISQNTDKTKDQTDKRPLHLPVSVGWIDPVGQEVEPVEVITSEGANYSNNVLELTAEHATIRFSGLPQGSLPSLLRNFSAPVKLDTDFTQDELIHLAKHDVDPFVRWESAQQTYENEIKRILRVTAEKNRPQVSMEVKALIQHLVVHSNEDYALLGELISLPSETLLADAVSPYDPTGIHYARKDMMRSVFNELKDDILNFYFDLQRNASGTDLIAKSARRLRSVLLSYIRFDVSGEEIIKRHYSRADTMTDRMAALDQAAHIGGEIRDRLFGDFYERFQNDPLVIDKWFAAQAVGTAEDGLENINKLLNHNDFILTNPNRIRALVASFAFNNPFYFHVETGEGYRILADVIARVDAVNPQTAARLVAPFGVINKLSSKRATLIREALLDMKSNANISDDVSELIAKVSMK